MKRTICGFMLLIAVTLSAQAERLTPTPEAGLWRSESRILTNHEQALRAASEAQPLSELSTTAYRTLMDIAISEAAPEIVMECIAANQAAELGHLFNLQRIIQRKLPECDLNLQKVDRSSIRVMGNCRARQGLNGALHGYVEFISSHEIHASFLGSDQSLARSGASSKSTQANVQRHEVHRWTSPDCGQVQPSETLSF
ncbi:MAG: hypothetical protein WC953_03115 [Pseudomonas sp.]